MLLSLVIKANEFGLKFILPYWGLIGFDIGFINLSNAFIDRLRVPIYHCKAPNKITTFKHKFIYSEKKIAYRNCQLFQFRLNQYNIEGEITIGGYICQVLYLSDFDDGMVDLYLNKRFPWKKYFFTRQEKISRAKMIIGKMGGMQYRPMLLAHIERLMESSIAETENSEYRIYKALLECWLSREEAKNDVFKNELFKICEVLAIRLSMASVQSLSSEELDWLIEENSKNNYIKPEDIKGRALLNCNTEGHYRFAHYSMQEFLVAKHFMENPQKEPEKIITMTSFIARLLISNSKLKECRKFFEIDRSIFKDLNIRGCSLRAAEMAQIEIGKIKDLKGVDFRGVNLSGVNLGEADLQVTNFHGVRLKNAILLKAKLLGANLQGADLEMTNLKSADLSWADLKGANLSKSKLSNAEFIGTYLQQTNFDKANLTKTVINECHSFKTSFIGSKLDETDFHGSELLEANFREAKGKKCNFSSTNLKESDFTKSSLNESNFNGAFFTSSTLRKAELQKCLFHGTNFEYTDFREADVKKSDFLDSVFEGIKFDGANLVGATFHGAVFQDLHFVGTVYPQADFSGAGFERIHFSNCRLEGANFGDSIHNGGSFEDTDLTGSCFLNAIFDGTSFTNVSLKDSNLRGATLIEINLINVDLTNADLYGADLTNVKNITSELLLKTKSLCNVKGLNPKIIGEIMLKKPSLFDEQN